MGGISATVRIYFRPAQPAVRTAVGRVRFSMSSNFLQKIRANFLSSSGAANSWLSRANMVASPFSSGSNSKPPPFFASQATSADQQQSLESSAEQRAAAEGDERSDPPEQTSFNDDVVVVVQEESTTTNQVVPFEESRDPADQSFIGRAEQRISSSPTSSPAAMLQELGGGLNHHFLVRTSPNLFDFLNQTNGFYKNQLQNSLKIAVLCPSYEKSNSPFKDYDDYLPDINLYNPYPTRLTFENVLIDKAQGPKQINDMVTSNKYDVYFNLCDGGELEDRAGAEIAELLLNMDVPYFGSGPDFHRLSKSQAKLVAGLCGIRTPRYFFVYRGDHQTDHHFLDAGDPDGCGPNDVIRPDTRAEIFRASRDLAFPLFVKHHNGGGSIGVTPSSKVYDVDQLLTEVNKVVREFGGALIEEFVRGREFTVLLLENPSDPDNPLIFTPFECILSDPDSFKDFNTKFIDYHTLHWVPVQESTISQELSRLAREMYVACGADSYARVDFRMCVDTGHVYFLEINPQCGIFFPKISWGSADFILNHTGSQGQFLDYALRAAYLNLHKRRLRSNGVRMLSRAGDEFLKLSHSIQAGQPIIDLTQLPHQLVNVDQLKSWSVPKRRLFDATALPLSQDLYIWLKSSRSHGFETNGITVIKRGSQSESNCRLDAQIRLVATKNIPAGQEAVLWHDKVVNF